MGGQNRYTPDDVRVRVALPASAEKVAHLIALMAEAGDDIDVVNGTLVIVRAGHPRGAVIVPPDPQLYLGIGDPEGDTDREA
jgi:hypothetical protein